MYRDLRLKLDMADTALKGLEMAGARRLSAYLHESLLATLRDDVAALYSAIDARLPSKPLPDLSDDKYLDCLCGTRAQIRSLEEAAENVIAAIKAHGQEVGRDEITSHHTIPC